MKLFSSKYSDNALSFGLFLLRIAMGGLMIPVGYNKLKNFSGMRTAFPDPFHIGSTTSLSLVVFAEFFCAVLIVLGLLTRFATIPLIITMLVVIIWVNKWVLTGGERGELMIPVLFVSGYLTLLFTGPGKFSLDRAIGK